jgi:ATP-dependent Clp protease adaptor protein ClpS
LPQFNTSTQTDTLLDTPRMYKVILHNDHYTSMDFVIKVLIEIFHKNNLEAQRIMINIHEKGKGLCGIYTYEIAATKVEQVTKLARAHEFPLLATLEEE